MFKIQNKTKIRKKLNQKKDYLFDFLYLCNFFSSASALSILSHQSFDKDFFNSCCSSSKLNQTINSLSFTFKSNSIHLGFGVLGIFSFFT
jgi:hypothetical protein